MQDAVRTCEADRLKVGVFADRAALGRAAGQAVAARLREVLKTKDAAIVLASAPSQNEFLAELSTAPDIDWNRVTAFHLDEYIGLSPTAPQAFAQFLRERLFHRIKPRQFYPLNGQAQDIDGECRRYEGLLKATPLDIACLGIGENGHLAFNDPPVADFADPQGVKVVELDAASREQQVADGCFAALADVPTHALSMTIPAILSARAIFCMVPGPRKAEAVRRTLHDPIATACPATVLRQHAAATLFVDRDSAKLL